ncbi:MAG: hypothetical protein ACREFO_09110 [Acetobacteraceae bacterium]
MTDRLAHIIFTIDQTICGHSIAVPGPGSPTWLVLVNIVVLVVPVLVTAATIVACFYFLIRPGERNEDHPKYRILSADR